MHKSTVSKPGNKAMVQDQKETLPPWISWLFGLALVTAVVLFATRRSERQAIADLVALSVHVMAILARLLGPGGIHSVVAESVLVKQQLLILNRSRVLPQSIVGGQPISH